MRELLNTLRSSMSVTLNILADALATYRANIQEVSTIMGILISESFSESKLGQ